MIYCVWYPSGGYGSFVTAIIDRFGKNFARPDAVEYEFSDNGNSHAANKTITPYRRIPLHYKVDIKDTTNHHCVAIDPGIDNKDNLKFLDQFPSARVIKITYDKYSWPVIAKTMIIKAMKSTLDQQLALENHWPSSEPWAVREKYFLYLVDNQLQNQWLKDNQFDCIDIAQIWEYKNFVNALQSADIELEDFRDTHQQWQQSNQVYFEPIIRSQQIVQQIRMQQHADLSDITDLWAQAVVNYYIRIEFGVTVPANTYANWFENTSEILNLLNDVS